MISEAPAPARVDDPGLLQRLLARRIPLSVEVLLYAALLSLAAAVRLWDLGANALHHDESIHALWARDLVRGLYTHNPVYHGPYYYHLEALFFFIFGANDFTSRLSAAVTGIALCALPLFLRKRLGPVGTLAAVAFIGFSPTIVYFSRFHREDIYMATFVMAMAVAMWRYFESGRDRWLIIFALALAGSFATKEATFLMVAIFLLFTNGLLAGDFARQTLDDRGTYSPSRWFMLSVGLFPYAWAVAAFWPFLGPFRRSAGWQELPRAGDVLIILGTLTVPLLMPFAKSPLESLGVVNPGQLDWPGVCQSLGEDSYRNRFALGGILTMSVAAVAFVGLQWRPRTWAIAAGGASFLYLTLMTTLWTNMNGVCSGPWGSLDYWLSQQQEYRADQPWFYYFMLMPAYEFLPLVIAIGGAWWATVRGNTFSRFLVFWIVGTFIVLSWAGEKMPWLNTHIALPVCLLAAWTVQRAWLAWTPHPPIDRRLAILFVSIAALCAGALAFAAFAPGGATLVALRWGGLAFAAALAAYAARPLGRHAVPIVLVIATVGAFSFFSLRTMVMVSFARGDVPKDLLIYTQSSPDIPKIMADIEQLAAANGKGYDIPIWVDTSNNNSFSWPWAWYLRDYNAVCYSGVETCLNNRTFDVMLVDQTNVSTVNDYLTGLSNQPFAAPQKYPHRWWFPEIYRQAMSVKEGVNCSASAGECGPFEPWINIGHGTHLGPPNVAVFKRIWEGVTEDGWLKTWFAYWRDHDPGVPLGSIDGYAYFPANFDRETGLLSLEPIEAARPSEDSSGRPIFGGVGFAPGEFFSPVDIASDADGNLYVIDRASRRLQKFDAEGNYLAGIDVRAADSVVTSDSEPWGLTVTDDGLVIVADTFGWRVRVFDSDLRPTGVSFGEAPVGDATGPFDLYGPRDAAVLPNGELWITDTGHHRIQVYDLSGNYVRTIGSLGAGPGEFNEPVGLAVAPDGSVFVADMFNGRVQHLAADGTFIGEFAVSGWGGQDPNDKPYLTVLRDGRIALSLPYRNEVRIYSPDGELLSTISDDSDPIQSPYGIVEAADATIWVVEGGSGRVRLFDIGAP